MKLLQLNMWVGRLRHPLFQLLEREQPDILCLQEALSSKLNNDANYTFMHQIQARTDYRHLAFAPMFTFNFLDGKVTLGNAILSRYPILRQKTVYVHAKHNRNLGDKDDYNVRNFLHTVIKTPRGKLSVITHHGFHIPDHKQGDERTLAQMKQLGEYIDKLAGPVVLGGDFNLTPHTESLEQINKRLRNLSIEAKLKTTRTQFTAKKEVCDYIFVNEEIKVKKFEALDDLLSDHKALLLEFDL